MYDGRCTYTDMSHAHFSGAHTLCAYFTHLHACHIHAWLKCPQKGSLHMCHTSPISLLMIHLSLLFVDGHLEANPDYDFTYFDIHEILPNFPDPKARVKRNSANASRSLATWTSQMQTQKQRPLVTTNRSVLALPILMAIREELLKNYRSRTSEKC